MKAGPARRAAELPPTLPVFVAPAHWRAIDFISDLHLAEQRPALFEAWAAHLRHTPADAVFILGDLFEAWVGDEAAATGFEARCVDVLAEAAKAKRIAFMAGNRDFLVGDAMLAAHGLMRLADPTIVVAFGERVLLSHGDALCIDDVGYQRYRSIVRRPGVQRAFKALPSPLRRAIGRAMRARGGRGHVPMRPAIDVDGGSALAWARAANASALVHGHTHAPATHAMAPGILRHVLTDWELDDAAAPRRAEVLRWRADGFTRNAPDGAGRTSMPSP